MGHPNTGCYSPCYGTDNYDSFNKSPTRMRDQSCAPGGRCSNKGSQEPSPAAVALNNQLQVQLALKRARQVASLQQQQTTWGPTHPFPWSITGGSVVPTSTCTQPGAVGTLPTVPEPFALSPISSSSGGSGGYQSRTYANQGWRWV